MKATTVSIAKADLLAKAKDVTHYYTGSALTTSSGLEIVYDGWKGTDGDNATNISSALSGATITLTSSQTAVGSETITPEIGDVNSIKNYNFVPVSGTVTIVKRKAQIVAKNMASVDFGTDESKVTSWTVLGKKASFNTYLELRLQNNAVGATTETFGDAETLADDAAVTAWLDVVGGSKSDKDNLKNFTLTRTTGTAVGEYVLTPAGGVLASGKSNQYQLAYKAGTFTIEPVAVTVTPANATKVYGDNDPASLPFNLTITTLTADEKTQISATRTEGETVGTYDITVSGPATIGGYNLTYNNTTKGKFMITQRPVTVTALPQLLYTGNTVNDLNVAEVTVEGILDGDPDIEVALSFDETAISNDANVSLDASTPKKLESDVDTKTVDDAIKVALKAGKEYPNYKFTFVPGDLTVVNLATVMLLTDADASLTDKLTAANGAKRNITFGARSLKKETWNVLVLPFATKVKDLSAALEYAVVDILDQTASDGNIHLKLHMGDIPANTPFLIKSYEDKDLKTVLFANKDIVYTAAGENVSVKDAAGNEFVGTYKATPIYGVAYRYLSGGEIYDAAKYTQASPANIKALRGYFKVANPAAAPVIYIEEPDGSTTAIETVSTVNAANGNDAIYNLAGQKVGADFKGIVIKNGKRYFQK